MVRPWHGNNANRQRLALTDAHPLLHRAWEVFNLTLQHQKNKEKHNE